MSRVLITGGAGFLGSHLCNHELLQGNNVFCLDDLSCSTGENIRPFLHHKNFHFINEDVRDPSFYLSDIDRIFHLACPASPEWYSRDPIKTLTTSVIGTKNMLDLANKTGARMLFTSTSEVYGDPEIHPQPESYNGNVSITGIRACYDEGKRAAETLCADYERTTNVDIRVVRLFNTYGPNMAANDGRVVSNFITQALANKPITIYGDGLQTRSFCYVGNMINMLYLVMNNAKNFGPMNLGNADEFTIKELAELISALTGYDQFEYRPIPQDDPKVRKPNLDKMFNCLNLDRGFFDYTDLKQGVQSTIDYFKGRVS